MKTLLLSLTIVVAAGMCAVSCRSDKAAGSGVAGPAYELGSAEFVKHTPPQFHQLKLGLAEESVLQAVGKPNHVATLWPAGQFDKTVGKRYTYRLSERVGVVWVDFDTTMHATGIFWRDRD